MKPQELAVQSFHENQKLLSAVNILSIHTKLEIEGRSNLNDEKAVEKAKDELCSFFKELEREVQDAEIEKQPLLGMDQRRQQFVRNFIEARRNYRIQSPLLRDKLSGVVQILHSEKEADKQAILPILVELRTLIEEHLENDVSQLLGGI